ncbi:MAG: DUF4835 family protein [Saprospiraceae bacterium]|jgi:hypothetical protein|nr:DUF4835 family protein [Saprospiraceae bacterium]
MFKSALLLFLLLTTFFSSNCQELNFNVTVVTQASINSLNSDVSIFKDLEKNLKEFINNTKWGEDDFQPHEKIRGSLQLTITEEVQPTVFKAELVVQTERPVYNSIYTSPMINLIDKNVTFSFNGLQPLFKTNNTFYDNLSSILSFYVYYSLGMDYDSFKMNGGEPYFQKAQEVISSLPSINARDEGWKNDGSGRRNRYWLVENILNPRMRQFRQAYYEYHRLCLDKMYDEPDKSRAVLLSAITSIGQANIDYPNTYIIQMFGDSKKDEIVEIFKIGDRGQKTKVKTIMVGMDPSKTEKYNALN